ncbi:MAG: PAS domain S-box protein [bacterium]
MSNKPKSDSQNKELTREFMKAFLNKYTYDPRSNLSARWALLWCTLLLILGILHLSYPTYSIITTGVDTMFGLIAIALYPTLGTSGTLYRLREETIKAYSKNLEKLVEQKTVQIRKKEKKYRTLFEIVPAGMFRVTEDLEIADINGYALDLIGLPQEQVIGRKCLDIICKCEGACALSGLTGEIATKEVALPSPDGSQNYVVISCRNWEMEGRSSIIGSITNINERKKLEETILENKQRLESIFDGMDDGIIVIGREFKVVAINRKWASIIGAPPDDLIGKRCTEVITPACQDIAKRVFLTGQKERKELILLHKGNGQQLYVDIIYAPILNKETRVEQVIGVLRDITEKKQMGDLLLRSERLATMGEIAANVAHEINNPMGIILGFTQRLLGRMPESSMDHEELQIIEQECIRCKKIITDLLDFARPSIPQKRLLQGEKLEEIINTCLKLLEYQINKRGIHVKRNLARGSMINIDTLQFQQVLMNIFLNAIQAMPGGGNLRVSVSTQTQHARHPNGLSLIAVEDTGVGIPPENMARICEPFFSAGKPNGTGLGLSVSKKIIEAHGGTLDIASEVGKGTKMTIELPL